MIVTGGHGSIGTFSSNLYSASVSDIKIWVFKMCFKIRRYILFCDIFINVTGGQIMTIFGKRQCVTCLVSVYDIEKRNLRISKSDFVFHE